MDTITHSPIRKAVRADLPALMVFVSDAQAFLRENGINQWQDNYPSVEMIAEDVDNGHMYLIEAAGVPVAMGAISFEPDSSYAHIFEGAWRTEEPYAVIHRVAVSAAQRGRGHARALFAWAEALAKQRGVGSIRVDTHPDNLLMRGMLERNGFCYCGIVYPVEQYGLVAYEKVLDTHLYSNSTLKVEL